jgi:hypothetical protein
MKYKIGDRVKIKSLDWFNDNKRVSDNSVVCESKRSFTEHMSKWCGQEVTIMSIEPSPMYGDYYTIDIDSGAYRWDDGMLEDYGEQKPLDLTEILKNAPEGFELYSAVYGKSTLVDVGSNDTYPIEMMSKRGACNYYTKDGKLIDCEDGECVLFPSKDNRDWSTFELPKWRAELYGEYYFITIIGEIRGGTDVYSNIDKQLWEVGNYFKTEEEAKESKFYKVFSR